MNHVETFMSSLLLFLLSQSCISIDTLTPDHTLADGELLVSKGGTFALGFFSPEKSSYRYVGIWYNKVPELTVVWVANRESPILRSAVALSMKSGNLILQGPNQTLYWSTSTNTTASSTKIAQLLDSGNLVLIQNDTKNVLWQSFDYPTNTLLPYMKMGLDQRTGLNRFLTSWKSPDDPGIGNYSYRLDPRGFSQLFLYKGPLRWWRTGPWNGLRFSGAPEMASDYIINASFVDNDHEIYVRYGLLNNSIFLRLVVDESGSIKQFTWQDKDSRWIEFWSAPKDRCDNYGQCGGYGNCNPYNVGTFECTCLPGYEPNSPSDWYLRDGSAGCVRKRLEPSTCGKGDGFVKVTHVKVPDTSIARVDTRMNVKECEQECLRNCSCKAYTSADVRGGGSGCVTWYGDLMDTREYPDTGQDLYIRVDAVELAKYETKSKGLLGKKGMLISVLVPSIIVILMVAIACWLATRKRKTDSTSFGDSPREKELDGSRTDPNLHLFELSTIVAATDNFSSANKLGQGGFGSVYKGCLVNGQEFAVKRLSKTSGQGMEEFKNEVTLIAKLQHRNLVRLLGCCIHGEEKMLIYEYLPNKSLDFFIFDKIRKTLLDWRKRYEIIFGIARGVLYLHQDSRLRIIHRDLKASNVLLDGALNPKISDFGMARIFGGDQIEANTNRVVGTYGYMSPEYAMEGLYSIKSDVFSFGILLLEIITGRKNNGYCQDGPFLNLIGHVWDLWREGNVLDIVDSSLGQSSPTNELFRCIHIGLLCVQECAADRPTMFQVVFMLGNETTLPSPKQPAFIFKGNYNGPGSSAIKAVTCSVNEVTLTTVHAR